MTCKWKKLEKLVLATILAGSMATCHSVLGNPAIVPDLEVYLIDENDSGAVGNSLSAGDISRLAECFKKDSHTNPNQPFEVMLLFISLLMLW